MAVSSTDKKSSSSVRDMTLSNPPFGSRFLTDESKVWSQNAWDHVPPPDDQEEAIAASLAKQKLAPVPYDDKIKYNEKPAKHWDNFYKMNGVNFFRNRKWLHNEFPELISATQAEAGPVTIAEIGCGAGNSVFPLLSANQNPELSLRAYDYSNHAVKLVQTNPLYISPPLGSISASVWDLTSTAGLPPDIEPASVDIVILVFVFSALHPDEWARAISNIHKMLKPQGLVVFRDYGRYDLTQLRFKTGRLLDDNFYIRGDKTRVYFFELDELSLLFTGSRVQSGDVVTHTEREEIEDESLAIEAESSQRRGTLQNSDHDGKFSQSSDLTLTSTNVDDADEVHENFSSSSLSTLSSLPNRSLHPSLSPSSSSSFLLPSSSSSSQSDLASFSPSHPSDINVSTSPPIIPSSTSSLPLSSSLSPTPSPHQPPPCSKPSSLVQTTVVHPNLLSEPWSTLALHPLFTTEQLGIDRRLLVNRKRQLKMYRVWMQGKFRKIG